jgi:hypothetical protein
MRSCEPPASTTGILQITHRRLFNYINKVVDALGVGRD